MTKQYYKYIVLLRGINVGGKNKVSMPTLKAALERQGFGNVVTYINSGNVILESGLSTSDVKVACEQVIKETFALDITVGVWIASDVVEALDNAPSWWNVGDDYKHNAIFVISPMTMQDALSSINIVAEYEMIASYGSVIFWSAQISTFEHTRWSEIAKNKRLYNAITIRGASTAIKLAQMTQ